MRTLELFSGAGGLALGLEQAGFEPVGLLEKNQLACNTLQINRPSWNIVRCDVRDVDYTKFSRVALVAGGPPCQPFSMGGKAAGYDDRRDMFPEAVRAVHELRPPAFIFENVRGLLRPCFKNYVEFIRLQLTYPDFPISKNVTWETNLQRLQRHHTAKKKATSLFYNVTINLVNAADYGVPQHRHRVFFVGFRHDVNAVWHFPSATHSGEALPPAGQQRWLTVSDAIAGLGEPSLKKAAFNHVPQPGARCYPGHTGSPLNEPAKALKAGAHGVPGGENMLRRANGSVRYFSVREAARVQTFPDDWQFAGPWTEVMRQLGNAVPVRLAGIVATSVAKSIKPYVEQTLQPA